MNEKPARTPNEWTLVEKQQAVFSYYKLGTEERGRYLRSEGLKSGDVERFEGEVAQALSSLAPVARRGAGRPARDPEVKRLQQQLKETQRELYRKDRALAETAARVVLLKKSRILFGLDDEEIE